MSSTCSPSAIYKTRPKEIHEFYLLSLSQLQDQTLKRYQRCACPPSAIYKTIPKEIYEFYLLSLSNLQDQTLKR